MYDPEKAFVTEIRQNERWTDYYDLVDRFGEDDMSCQWHLWFNELFDSMDKIENDINNCFDEVHQEELENKLKNLLDVAKEGLYKRDGILIA